MNKPAFDNYGKYEHIVHQAHKRTCKIQEGETNTVEPDELLSEAIRVYLEYLVTIDPNKTDAEIENDISNQIRKKLNEVLLSLDIIPTDELLNYEKHKKALEKWQLLYGPYKEMDIVFYMEETDFNFSKTQEMLMNFGGIEILLKESIPFYENESPATSTLTDSEDFVFEKEIIEKINKLTLQEQKIVYLKFEGENKEEIAKLLNVSISRINSSFKIIQKQLEFQMGLDNRILNNF